MQISIALWIGDPELIYVGLLRNRFKVRVDRRSIVASTLGRTGAKNSQEEAPTAFDPSMLEYAHTQMEKWTEDYSDWAMENTRNLIALYKCVATKTGPEQDQALIKIKEIISDLKSHGREFGYPLISEIATSLSSIAYDVQITRRHLALFGNHIDALRVVSRKRIKGAGGDVGRELIGSLHKADAKLKVVH